LSWNCILSSGVFYFEPPCSVDACYMTLWDVGLMSVRWEVRGGGVPFGIAFSIGLRWSSVIVSNTQSLSVIVCDRHLIPTSSRYTHRAMLIPALSRSVGSRPRLQSWELRLRCRHQTAARSCAASAECHVEQCCWRPSRMSKADRTQARSPRDDGRCRAQKSLTNINWLRKYSLAGDHCTRNWCLGEQGIARNLPYTVRLFYVFYW